jgi:hypothetical protein
MKLIDIATEISVTGSKTFGFYCSFYIGTQQYKKKAFIKDNILCIIFNSKTYEVKSLN